jgi:mannitol-specific phosphotransferase system IIBC component
MWNKDKQLSVVNLENLEVLIRKVEELFKENNINIEDQHIVLSRCIDRVVQKKRQAQTQDIAQNLLGGGLIDNVMKKMNKDKDEDKNPAL